MKVGIITKTNSKGQIVIPKEVRDKLDINALTPLNIIVSGKGMYIYPIDEVLTKIEREDTYLSVLEKTKGALADQDWDLLRKKRQSIELAASQKRKNT